MGIADLKHHRALIMRTHCGILFEVTAPFRPKHLAMRQCARFGILCLVLECSTDFFLSTSLGADARLAEIQSEQRYCQETI